MPSRPAGRTARRHEGRVRCHVVCPCCLPQCCEHRHACLVRDLPLVPVVLCCRLRRGGQAFPRHCAKVRRWRWAVAATTVRGTPQGSAARRPSPVLPLLCRYGIGGGSEQSVRPLSAQRERWRDLLLSAYGGKVVQPEPGGVPGGTDGAVREGWLVAFAALCAGGFLRKAPAMAPPAIRCPVPQDWLVALFTSASIGTPALRNSSKR